MHVHRVHDVPGIDEAPDLGGPQLWVLDDVVPAEAVDRPPRAAGIGLLVQHEIARLDRIGLLQDLERSQARRQRRRVADLVLYDELHHVGNRGRAGRIGRRCNVGQDDLGARGHRFEVDHDVGAFGRAQRELTQLQRGRYQAAVRSDLGERHVAGPGRVQPVEG